MYGLLFVTTSVHLQQVLSRFLIQFVHNMIVYALFEQSGLFKVKGS